MSFTCFEYCLESFATNNCIDLYLNNNNFTHCLFSQRGLAFSPDNKYLYLAYQSGAVYEFWRDDGKPFNGTVADTKYHSSDSR